MKSLNQHIQEKYLIDINTKHANYKENWSIKNAEDGDIVVWNNKICFIYKCLYNEYHGDNNIGPASKDAIVFHALYTLENKSLCNKVDIGIGTISYDGPKYRLATDKECDEIYDALKKEGCEWNYEKKEIVKA